MEEQIKDDVETAKDTHHIDKPEVALSLVRHFCELQTILHLESYLAIKEASVVKFIVCDLLIVLAF